MAGLETYILSKLQNRSGAAADAASTSLALWLLEAILSRTHSAPAPGNDSVFAGTPLASSVNGTTAEATHIVWNAHNSGVLQVTDFVKTYQNLLPYTAVEQILLASGCHEHLQEVARLYETWQTVFDLSLASALPTRQYRVDVPRKRPPQQCFQRLLHGRAVWHR